MKKSIVLLITLFFILALSVLIVKNLDSSKRYLENSAHTMTRTQGIILALNFKDELFRFYKSNAATLEVLLQSTDLIQNIALPFDVFDVKITQLKNYEREVNINNLLSKEEAKRKRVEDFFMENDIEDIYVLEELLIAHKFINNSKQLKAIILDYIDKVNSNNIESYMNKIGFFEPVGNMKLVEAQLHYFSEGSSYKASYILDLKNEKVKDFDFSIKE